MTDLLNVSDASLAHAVRARWGSLSYRAAAREAGVTATTILRVESGHAPSFASLAKLTAWIESGDPGSPWGSKGRQRPYLPAPELSERKPIMLYTVVYADLKFATVAHCLISFTGVFTGPPVTGPKRRTM